MESLKTILCCLCIGMLAIASVFLVEIYVPNIDSNYWVMHAIWGIGGPFLFGAGFQNFRLGLSLVVLWTLGNELIQDPIENGTYSVQVDQLLAGLFGSVLAVVIMKWIRRCTQTRCDA